jgi:DTW domain-containing protein YfiP
MRFAIVRHVRETTKSTSTARWARLLVPGCELHEYRERADAGSLALGAPGDWLLFPSDGGATGPQAPPERLIVLDGTWRQARRMLRAIPALQRIPRLTVPPRPQGKRLRVAPNGGALSTLEAMAGAVACLESAELGAVLLQSHDALVDRVLRARGRPGLERAE